LAALYSILETERHRSLGGCSALTPEGPNTLISQPIIVVSAISSSTQRIGDNLVENKPNVYRPYSNRSFLGVIRSTPAGSKSQLRRQLF
jgi:hypothetical protein